MTADSTVTPGATGTAGTTMAADFDRDTGGDRGDAVDGGWSPPADGSGDSTSIRHWAINR